MFLYLYRVPPEWYCSRANKSFVYYRTGQCISSVYQFW